MALGIADAAGAEHEPRLPLVLARANRRTEAGISLGRPHALAIEMNLVRPHAPSAEALEHDERIVVAIDAEGAPPGVEHGHFTRGIRLDPHSGLGAARVTQEGSRTRSATARDSTCIVSGEVSAALARAGESVDPTSSEEELVSTWLWIIIALAAIVIVALAAWTIAGRRRSERLREGFGAEYDRTVDRTGDRRAAEEQLLERQERHDELDLRPLAPRVRAGYMEAWKGTQAAFVDDPSNAIRDADRLIQSVMRERGYPVEDFDDRASIVSVDHPEVVERYRRAHAIAETNEDGDADTEQLRHALQDYRALFVELVEVETVRA